MGGKKRESTARAFSKSCTCVSFRRRDPDWECARRKPGWQVVFRLLVCRLENGHPDDAPVSVIDAFGLSRLLTTVLRLASWKAKDFPEEKFLRMARDVTLCFEVSAIFLAIIHYLEAFTGLRLRQIASGPRS